jgi:uncharacterized protein (TIGR02757 family)
MNAFTPATYALTSAFARGAAEADRAQKAILRNRRGSENLGEPAEPDTPLKFHLPQAVLRVRVAEAEERIGFVRREDVRNGVRVANDFHRRVHAGDRHPPVDLRQRSTEVDVGTGGGRDEQCERERQNFHEQSAHVRIILRLKLKIAEGRLQISEGRLQIADLKPVLDRLYTAFNYPDSAADPIQIVRRFSRADDREVVGFIAASLAFGRVSSVLQSIERVLTIAGEAPAAYVRRFDPSRDSAAFAGVVHRWTRGPDLVALLWIMRQMIDRSGSIEQFFADGDAREAEDVGAAIDSFSSRALALDMRRAYGRVPRRPGVCYFFPRPSAGSGCKRLNLFLRWMVRRDALDLGVWTKVAPAKLIVPLDTHVIRVGRCLGLTTYTSPGWRMARDITSSLRRIDPEDPVKYDFAMCHLGMMNACGFNRGQSGRASPDGSADRNCPLRGVCRPHARKRPRSRQPSGRP